MVGIRKCKGMIARKYTLNWRIYRGIQWSIVEDCKNQELGNLEEVQILSRDSEDLIETTSRDIFESEIREIGDNEDKEELPKPILKTRRVVQFQ